MTSQLYNSRKIKATFSVLSIERDKVTQNLAMISDMLNLNFMFCVGCKTAVTTLITSKLISKFDIT